MYFDITLSNLQSKLSQCHFTASQSCLISHALYIVGPYLKASILWIYSEGGEW